MRMAGFLLSLLIIQFCSVYCCAQSGRQRRSVTVTTSDDKRYSGRFIRADESGVVIENEDGQTTIKLDRVKLIAFGDVSANIPPLNEPDKQSSGFVVKQNQFTFQVQECRMSSTSVVCKFFVTNDGSDRELDLLGCERTRLFDDLGNSYGTSRIKFANAGMAIPFCGVLGMMVSGVRGAGEIQFNNVSPQATKVTLLQIRGAADRQVPLDITFRNVPLLK